MESRLNNQNLILFRQLVKFCKSWIFCSKLSPLQEREAVAEFRISEVTNTRWMRSFTIEFERQHSTVSIVSIWLWMAIPKLALLNIFISNPDGGMECVLSKCTDQSNIVSMWKQLSSLVFVKPLWPLLHPLVQRWDQKTGCLHGPCRLRDTVRYSTSCDWGPF